MQTISVPILRDLTVGSIGHVCWSSSDTNVPGLITDSGCQAKSISSSPHSHASCQVKCLAPYHPSSQTGPHRPQQNVFYATRVDLGPHGGKPKLTSLSSVFLSLFVQALPAACLLSFQKSWPGMRALHCARIVWMILSLIVLPKLCDLQGSSRSKRIHSSSRSCVHYYPHYYYYTHYINQKH